MTTLRASLIDALGQKGVDERRNRPASSTSLGRQPAALAGSSPIGPGRTAPSWLDSGWAGRRRQMDGNKLTFTARESAVQFHDLTSTDAASLDLHGQLQLATTTYLPAISLASFSSTPSDTLFPKGILRPCCLSQLCLNRIFGTSKLRNFYNCSFVSPPTFNRTLYMTLASSFHVYYPHSLSPASLHSSPASLIGAFFRSRPCLFLVLSANL